MFRDFLGIIFPILPRLFLDTNTYYCVGLGSLFIGGTGMDHSVPMYVIEYVAKRISGDIIWSDNPGSELRKWREVYGLSQTDIARLMSVSYSVVSDYERGKREPGRRFIKQFVRALLEHDQEHGWLITQRVARLLGFYVEGVIDMAEFLKPLTIDEAVQLTQGILLSSTTEHRPIKGYTIVDSIKTIESLASSEFVKLMGATSERLIVFTKITRGRSPLVAIKVAPVKPSLVVLHGIKKVDILAIRIANKEDIPLVIAPHIPIEEITYNLRKHSLTPIKLDYRLLEKRS